jgi:hypothetical protein
MTHRPSIPSVPDCGQLGGLCQAMPGCPRRSSSGFGKPAAPCGPLVRSTASSWILGGHAHPSMAYPPEARGLATRIPPVNCAAQGIYVCGICGSDSQRPVGSTPFQIGPSQSQLETQPLGGGTPTGLTTQNHLRLFFLPRQLGYHSIVPSLIHAIW